ncbi:MAG TPA: IS110 family transposase [Gemmataceae bacterium]|nr:IS110 family transposase [Gemmataceae bacterium]
MATGESTTTQQAKQRKAYRRRKARGQARAARAQEAEAARVEGLPVTQAHAAGIDIGSRSHWVCVGCCGNDGDDLIQEFPAHTEGLHQILAYLRQHGVVTVALESSGVYWIPLYELLEANGFEVLLVDPSYTKQVKGRPKTDRRDCQWIYRLPGVGLLAGAFRLDEKTCQLRSYLRQRANLIRYAGQHIQHMEKALEQMNLKLTESVSDITGVTGRAIIQAILKGTRDPHKLAKLRNRRCKASEAEIAQALNGSYRDEHLFALRQAYEAWQFYQKQVGALEEQIELQLGRMKQDRALRPLKPRPGNGGRKPNQPRFDVRSALYYVVGIDLTELEGIGEQTALTIISEIGPEVSRFATVKHFCSWLGLCPQLQKTGGRVRSSRTRPGVNRAAVAFRLAANGLYASQGALGAFLRRQKARLGAPQAVTATAHKLARIVYLALKHGLAYVRQSQEEYEVRLRDQQIKAVKRKARQLDLEVIDKQASTPAAGAAAAGAAAARC